MSRSFHLLTKSLLASLFLSACFNDEQFPFTDNDGDGFALEFGDCDDNDPEVNPGEDEDCDNKDNNCDGEIDEDPNFDQDNDGFTFCELPVPDCNDNNPDVRPGAAEVANGIDDDCNGFIDDQFTDNDGDGFCEDPNSCVDGSTPGDCDDAQGNVNPNAIEFEGDGVDNNCNGQIDEPFVPCDSGLSNNVAGDFAKAIELCFNEVQTATFIGNVGSSRAIVASFGNDPFNDALNVPTNGARMIHLSTGNANQNAHDRGTPFDGAFANGDGVGQCTSANHPDRQLNAPANGCGDADPAQVCDLTGINLTIKVPSNALSFSFDFQFFSSEYPTFRCSQFDDTFVAFLTPQDPNSPTFRGNVSFDATGSVVSVNNGFFEICIDDNNNVNGGPPNDCNETDFSSLSGTGYNINGGQNSIGAGATRRLTTTVGVVPNEIINLKFQIFDEGDDILDSSVLIDNFTWDLTPAQGAVTID